jgi:RecA/RadA recombinase
MTSQRHRRLDAVVARLQLEHGSRVIRRAGPDEGQPKVGTTPPIARIATSFAELDAVLDGGLPQGCITEISGPATSGKLTVAAKTIAAIQSTLASRSPDPKDRHRLDADVLAAWIDPGYSCDPDYMHRCGVDLNRLLVVHPVNAEDALSIVLYLVESNTLALLVVDWESSLWGAEVAPAGQEAALARLSSILPRTATAVIFLSEPRRQSHILAHAAAVRIILRREQWIIRDDGDVRGYIGQAEIVKNRFGHTGMRATVRITFNGTVRGDGL